MKGVRCLLCDVYFLNVAHYQHPTHRCVGRSADVPHSISVEQPQETAPTSPGALSSSSERTSD